MFDPYKTYNVLVFRMDTPENRTEYLAGTR